MFRNRSFLLCSLLAGACTRQAPAPAAPVAPAPVAATASSYTLDESKLQTPNHFEKTDLDPSKDPCRDFVGYVNGKFLAANAIPADRTTWGSFEMLAERATGVQRQIAEQAAARTDATGVDKLVGDFYATAMDEKRINALGLTPLRGRLADIDALTDSASVAELLRRTHARGEGMVFSFGAQPDFQAPDMMTALAFQDGLGLPDKTYYFDADKKDKLAAYGKHVARVLELSGIAATDAARQAEQVLAFETELAKVSVSDEELSRDTSLFSNPVTLADADKLTPAFPWSKFFESQGLTPPAKFSLAIPAFHKEVNALIEKAPIGQWKAYLRYHTVDGFAPYLSDPFVQEDFAFHSQAMRGQKEMKARWKRALGIVNSEVGQALGQLYVKVAFSPEAKARMEKLVANLSTALKARLENLDWMSPATKKRALEKWAGFRPKIGYPDKWRDWSGVVTSRDSLLDNVFATTVFNYRYELAKIGKPVDKTEWSLLPQTVNANYSPQRNEVTFPAAILQSPFFDLHADDALNYGGIGAVIGHEMIHGYDDQGSRFGPSGKFENWWTAEDAKSFSHRTNKLEEQFNGYEALPGKKVNGHLTLGENIADLGGIAIAYAALENAAAGQPDAKIDGMTREQRFFYNWATIWRRDHTKEEMMVRLATDPHAPASFRAIGAPSNLDEFSKAFSCKPKDPMVRASGDRISIW